MFYRNDYNVDGKYSAVFFPFLGVPLMILFSISTDVRESTHHLSYLGADRKGAHVGSKCCLWADKQLY